MKISLWCLFLLCFLSTKGLAESLKPSDLGLQSTPFHPPEDDDIPKNEFGDLVRKGENIFVHTGKFASEFVGNDMRCVNCHLDRGRQAGSAPIWAAYVMYPSFRKKSHKVDTIENRIQDCFRFSMNGKAPPVDGEVMKALVAYHFWLSKGAQVGVELPGRGYPKLEPLDRPLSYETGEKVYHEQCGFCHGVNGDGVQGTTQDMVIPPLWGKSSFNWGAGMHRVDVAASFIQANMPYGRGHSLNPSDAWDVAFFINSHERPQDPRFEDSVKHTKEVFHSENCRYGEQVKGKVLGHP